MQKLLRNFINGSIIDLKPSHQAGNNKWISNTCCTEYLRVQLIKCFLIGMRGLRYCMLFGNSTSAERTLCYQMLSPIHKIFRFPLSLAICRKKTLILLGYWSKFKIKKKYPKTTKNSATRCFFFFFPSPSVVWSFLPPLLPDAFPPPSFQNISVEK